MAMLIIHVLMSFSCRFNRWMRLFKHRFSSRYSIWVSQYNPDDDQRVLSQNFVSIITCIASKMRIIVHNNTSIFTIIHLWNEILNLYVLFDRLYIKKNVKSYDTGQKEWRWLACFRREIFTLMDCVCLIPFI